MLIANPVSVPTKPSKLGTVTLEILLGSDRLTAISTLTNHVRIFFNDQLVSEKRNGLLSTRSRHQFWVHQPRATQYEVLFDTKWYGAVKCTVIRNGQTIHQQDYFCSLKAGRFISKDQQKSGARFGFEGLLGEGNFATIATEQEALQALKTVAGVFYGMGIINLAIGSLFPQARDVIPDGVVFILLAFAVYKRRSRIAAILAIIQAIFVFGISVNAILTYGAGAIHRILISSAVLAAAIRGTQATFSYHRLLRTHFSLQHFLLKTVLGVLYGIIFMVLSIIAAGFILSILGKQSTRIFAALLVLYAFSLGLIMSYLGWLPFTKKKPVMIKGT